MRAAESLPYTLMPHLPAERLTRLLQQADTFLKNYRHAYQPDATAQALLAQHRGDVAAAVLAKIGNHNFCKRRPDAAHMPAYHAYLRQQLAAVQPLHFRVGFGPLKNMQRYGDCQRADSAEYLTFVQLARLAQALQTLYPYGISMAIVPDNLRAQYANRISPDCVADYIDSLQHMVRGMGLQDWLQIADGQQALYADYRVSDFYATAEQNLRAAKAADETAFATSFAVACANAAKNLAGCNVCSADDAAGAAWRYLVAYEAEVLAGIWSATDAFPLQYARRAGFFQLFTLYKEETAMPWQILLPVPSAVRHQA